MFSPPSGPVLKPVIFLVIDVAKHVGVAIEHLLYRQKKGHKPKDWSAV